MAFDGDTTTTLKKIAPGLAWLPRVLRENFTVAGAWSIAGVIFGAGVSWAYLSARLGNLEEAVREEKAQAEKLSSIDRQLGIITTKIDDLKEKVDQQQEKWNKVEEVAEMPRRRRR